MLSIWRRFLSRHEVQVTMSTYYFDLLLLFSAFNMMVVISLSHWFSSVSSCHVNFRFEATCINFNAFCSQSFCSTFFFKCFFCKFL